LACVKAKVNSFGNIPEGDLTMRKGSEKKERKGQALSWREGGKKGQGKMR